MLFSIAKELLNESINFAILFNWEYISIAELETGPVVQWIE